MEEVSMRDSALLYEEQAMQDVTSMVAKWNISRESKVETKSDAYVQICSHLEGLLDTDVFSLDELDEAIMRIADEITARSG